VKVVRLIVCISVLLGNSVSPGRGPDVRGVVCVWLVGTCPWLVSQWVFGSCAKTDGSNIKEFSAGPEFARLLAPAPRAAGINKKEIPRPEPKDLYLYAVCARGDLNPHARRHRNLNPACLPISPLALGPATCFRLLSTRLWNVRRRMPVFIVALRRRGLRQRRSDQASSFRSRRSLATCPVARTLYCASATFPAGSTTMVERIRPW
jgi:hypothetical protein